MRLSHTRRVTSARFDDPNLVSCAGLVPMAALAEQCGLAALADEHLSVPTDKGIRGSIPLLVGKPGWSVPVLPLRQRRYPSRKLTVGVRVKA